MHWLLAGLIAVALGALWWRARRRHVQNWARLECVLGEVAEGRPVGSVVFSDRAGQFARLTPLLDRLALKLANLRRQISREEFNLQTILASMEEGVMVVDTQHVLRLSNPSFASLFELRADPCGQTVLHTLRETAFQDIVAAAFATGEPQTREVEMNNVRAKRHFAVHANPIRDETGRAGTVVVFRDITRLRQLEDVRREFVANVSHELRTPLSIFHGYVETLIDSPDMDREDRVEVFGVLRRHSRRLNALIEDLLSLARLESRHETLNLAPIEIGEFLRTLSVDWARKLAEKGIALSCDLQADLPPLHADRLRLEQVFGNLLENAVKYTGPDGRIDIRARVEGACIEFRVEDTGLGILPADVPHIFERFYRADKARSREHGGTGLGLSIVKHIVQSHGGTVTAESTYGEGTTIALRLPLGGKLSVES